MRRKLIQTNKTDILDERLLYQNKVAMVLAGQQSKEARLITCEKVAAAISKLLKEYGECTKSDLLSEGFLKSEVDHNWPIAYALAKVELNWMDG